MKANELMIGDWVLDTRTGIPLRVNPFMAEFEVPEWQPIPLTLEILKKNGILHDKCSFYYVIKDDENLECTYYIRQTSQGNWEIGVDIGAYTCPVFVEIKYVHELQHALRLYKIDKEIII